MSFIPLLIAPNNIRISGQMYYKNHRLGNTGSDVFAFCAPRAQRAKSYGVLFARVVLIMHFLQDAYARWACAAVLPHWTTVGDDDDDTTTAAQGRRYRVRACRSVCLEAEQTCPWLLPVADDANPYAGEAAFTCIGKNRKPSHWSAALPPPRSVARGRGRPRYIA